MLEGPASGGVRGLPLTAENYESAKSILKKWFVQPQVIINAHMEGLVKVSAVRVTISETSKPSLWSSQSTRSGFTSPRNKICIVWEAFDSPFHGNITTGYALENFKGRGSNRMGIKKIQENFEEREVEVWRAFVCSGGSGECTELESTQICIRRRYRGTPDAFSSFDRKDTSVHLWRICNWLRRWNGCPAPHQKAALFVWIARSILEPLETWVLGGSKGAPQAC